jgi:hypothetical protein
MRWVKPASGNQRESIAPAIIKRDPPFDAPMVSGRRPDSGLQGDHANAPPSP